MRVRAGFGLVTISRCSLFSEPPSVPRTEADKYYVSHAKKVGFGIQPLEFVDFDRNAQDSVASMAHAQAGKEERLVSTTLALRP